MLMIEPLLEKYFNEIISLRNSYIIYLRQDYYLNELKENKWYSLTKDQYFVILYNKKIVGCVGITCLDMIHRKAELSLITKDYLIKEYADFALDFVEKYAFEKLSLNKLYITVFEWDEKKIEYFKNRYTLECFLREDVMYKGKYYNHYYFSKLAKEYFK